LDQYSGTEIGRRGKEAVAASVDHASSRVVKKNFLRNEDDALSYLKNNILQKKPSRGGGKKKTKFTKICDEKESAQRSPPQYSDCAEKLDNENDVRKRDDGSTD
jgi:hypothetical protein